MWANWELTGKLWQGIRGFMPAENLQSLDVIRVHQSQVERVLMYHVFLFMKFFDETKAEDDPENYYMEREWRVTGDVPFELTHVKRVVIPGEYSERFHRDVPDYHQQVSFI
jgi:hypothetical protein